MKPLLALANKIAADRVRFEPGDIVLQELENSASLFIIVEGEVRILAGPDRFEIATSGPGDIIGELSFIDDRPHTATAVAKTRTVVLAISHAAFFELATSAPELAYEFNQELLRTIVSRFRDHIDLQRRHQQQAEHLEHLSNEIAAVNRELSDALEQTRATQAELIAASRLATVGQLASGMAHELNSPVAAMLRASAQLGADLQDLLKELVRWADAEGSPGAFARIVPLLTRIFETMLKPDMRSIADERQAKRALEREILKRHPAMDRARMALLTRLAPSETGPDLIDSLASAEDSSVRAATSVIGLADAARSLAISAERVEHVVRGLQGYSRVDQETTTPTDIRQGIHETLALFTHAFKSDVVLETELLEVPVIEARPAELNQVWTNLIQNAVQAMGTRGTLTVRTELVDGAIQASFRDTGPGIPEENLGRIFDLNFSTKSGSRRFGFGVGLAIAKTIVAAHGGRITVTSKPGDTEFLVRLPATNETRE